MKSSVKNNIPYIGLLSYSENDSSFFWGRDDEIDKCTRIILDNVSTMLFGPSGCGKSSLVKAGIIPEFKSYQYHSIYISPRKSIYNNNLNLWSTINKEINTIIENNSLVVRPKYEGHIWATDLSLWEKLNCFDYVDEYGFDNYFLIVIDQFEEIFQQDYSIRQIESIFSEYELLCGYYKEDHLLREFKNKTLFDYESYISCKERVGNNPHRFVISIRQDYMFEMESYSERYPVLYGNRICVNPLNEEQAFKIITTSIKDDGSNWFSGKDAINIIQDLTGRNDFKINDVPEIEVDAMMLSLYLTETCMKMMDDTNYRISEEGHDASSIIKDYYLRHMNCRGIDIIEKELVSSDGKYRKAIPLSDATLIVPEEKLREYDDLGLLNIYKNHKIDWVELRHDKLCPCAAYHSSLELIKKRNQKIFSPFLFLLPQGRLHFVNNTQDVNPNCHNSYAGWLSQIIKKGYVEDVNIELSGLLRNSTKAHNCSLKINLNDIHGIRCFTDDGIGEITVKLVNGKLYEIAFFKNNSPCSLYYGAHKVSFYYDKKGRLILSDFYDISNTRICMEDGFTSVLYGYTDEKEVPSVTYYLKIPVGLEVVSIANPKNEDFFESILKYKSWHKDGNYGYKSTYDEKDIEIKRTFLNKDGIEDVILNGYSELRFEKNKDGAITSCAYYLLGEKFEYKNIHKTKYEYDSFGEHVVRELFYDKYDAPVATDTGIYGMSYDFDESVIKATYLNEKGEASPDIEGTVHQKIIIDSSKQIECILLLDSKGKLHYTTDFGCAVQYMVNYPNSQIKNIFRFDDQLQLISIDHKEYEPNRLKGILYDDTCNIQTTYELERNGYVEKRKCRNKFGQIDETLCYEREKIGPNTYVFGNATDRYAFVLDERENIVKKFRCDNNNNQIADENGLWEERSEYLYDRLIKTIFLSQGGAPFEIEPGVYGYGFEYGKDSTFFKTYELDYYGNRNKTCVKYHFSFDLDDYAYFDESSVPYRKTMKNGIHSVRTIKTDDTYEVRHYDVDEQLCNCSEGWSVFIVESTEETQRQLYLDCDGSPVNGPNGWHQYVEEPYVDKKGRSLLSIKPHCYLDTNDQLVENTIGDASLKIIKIPLIMKWRFSLKKARNDLQEIMKEIMKGGELYLVHYCDAQNKPYKSLFIKQDKNNSREIEYPLKRDIVLPNKTSCYPTGASSYKLYGINPYDTKGMLVCIFVEQGYERSTTGCKERDVILKLGDWSVFNYIDSETARYKNKTSFDDLTNDFERFFNDYNSSNELIPLLFARLSEDNQWSIYSTQTCLKNNQVSIGRMVDRKISRNAYKEIFECYSKFKDNSQDTENGIDSEGVVRRIKELLKANS